MKKDYVAKHYVPYNDVTYTPGEVFSADLSKEDEDRLLRLGAITPADRPSFDTDEPDGALLGLPAEDNDATVDAEAETQDEVLYEDEADADAEEPAPAPEINVMDGIGKAKKTTTRGTKK